MRTGAGPAGAVVEALGASVRIAVDPLVAGLAADAEAATELGEREELTLEIGDESYFLVHR
jgi:hypothetical protein